MTLDHIAAVLWRRRLTFLLTVLSCVSAIVAVTLVLPKTYQATATLLVGTPKSTFQTTDLLNQVTRTYSTLAANPNIAESVAARLPFAITRDELAKKIAITPVESTQLIEVSAEARTATKAQLIANAYASGFVAEITPGLGSGDTLSEVSMIERAVRPSSAVKPNPPLYIGLGTLLAVLIAIGAAVLRERVDRRVRLAPEEESFLGYPILARIPRYGRRDAAGNRHLGDRFALLKTNLDFLEECEARVIVVTSPGVAEGKSTVAMHLAAACFADDERVVVVEADLRKPGLGNAAGLKPPRRGRLGLADYLIGDIGEEDVLATSPEHPGIMFVWSGKVVPNPVALLTSKKFDALLDTLRADFDRVIIDTPPISVGADASLLAARAEAVLYIVNEPSTTRGKARSGINQLEKVRPSQLGVVVNRASGSKSDGYYYGSIEKETEQPAEGSTRSRVRA